MDLKTLAKPSFNFGGVYRGFVENNVDPQDLGRVQVRIIGIHDLNGEITPIASLPWAYPALGLYWSGGHNITNKDHETETPDTIANRYDPGSQARQSTEQEKEKNKNKQQNILDQSTKTTKGDPSFALEQSDELANACGTGGHFVVPKRGNWVFLFFEGGNHMYPVYFAMAPMARDWTTQKTQRDTEIKEKVSQIETFKKSFGPRKESKPSDKETWAPESLVNVLVDKPDLTIPPIDGQNRDVYSITSAKGTTIAIDNRFGKEKFYIIHKNSIEHIDQNGNKKVYVGRSYGKTASDDPDTPANYEIGIEGDHELFIVGDWKVYPKGNIFIQTDGNTQIDVNKNVGIVCREGDVNLIVEKGNVNADIKGNVDVNVGKNANLRIANNANIMVEKNLKATIKGNADVDIHGASKLKIDGASNMTIGGAAKINVSGDANITAPNVKIKGNVDITGNVKVNGTLDISRDVKVGANLYVLAGINCGGYLKNRGPVDIGTPVIAHGLIVIGGSGTGTGQSPAAPKTPETADKPTEATREEGIKVDKSDLENKTTPNEVD